MWTSVIDNASFMKKVSLFKRTRKPFTRHNFFMMISLGEKMNNTFFYLFVLILSGLEAQAISAVVSTAPTGKNNIFYVKKLPISIENSFIFLATKFCERFLTIKHQSIEQRSSYIKSGKNQKIPKKSGKIAKNRCFPVIFTLKPKKYRESLGGGGGG